ncbi:hypothetical protein K431DRAFT_309982 [Polychaeton citri CBS 116435]|uniref:DUF7892 domain-containing protein n=1 Tax=Polychaeton citri CBS 116435 TaxID=1314669 RepID=A0A9P4QGD8_9PEZI|nr:hypothetical protein K431DRAFT_309982 [Polychaeton citri CBS 116435]
MDGLNGRNGSRSASSSSDFYDSEPSNLAPKAGAMRPLEQHRVQDAHSGDQSDGNSSDEMEISSDEDSEAEVFMKPEVPIHRGHVPLSGQKRKASPREEADPANGHRPDEPSKRPKLYTARPVAGEGTKCGQVDLSDALWQQIFLRLSPAMLSRSIRVCRRFQRLLTQSQGELSTGRKPKDPFDAPPARVLDDETIWSSSRKACFPHLPRPLNGFSEHEMIKLVAGQACQFCQKLPAHLQHTDPKTPGPGLSGVRILWLFGVRICGTCLEKRTVLDIDLHKDFPRAAEIRLGLPFAFRTPALHIIPRPSDNSLRANKIYYREHASKLQKELEEAEAYGEGAAEEWKKGLAKIRADAEADALKWEAWEKVQGPEAALSDVLQSYDTSSFPHIFTAAGSEGKSTDTLREPSPNGHIAPAAISHTPASRELPQHSPAQRHLRSEQDLHEARLLREMGFTNRCLKLKDPIEPSIMRRMPVFRNAMQMIKPLDDQEWEALKPAFLDQRHAAAEEEYRYMMRQAALAANVPDTSFRIEGPQRPIKDHAYNDAQAPLRSKLAEWADEFLNLHTDRGCIPQLAVDCILFVQRKYVEDRNSQQTKPKIMAGAVFSPAPLNDPILSLDNMKWLHANKLKSLENGEKKWFVCVECDSNEPIWLSFESLLQHFNAKHTSGFGDDRGAIDWRNAHWPDEPPFITDPAKYLKDSHRSNHSRKHRDNGQNLPLLSDSPYFSSIKRERKSSHSTGLSPAIPTLQQPKPKGPGHDQTRELEKISKDMLWAWNTLQGIHGIPECISVAAALHHSSHNRKGCPREDVTMDKIIDASSLYPNMALITELPVLACKCCITSQLAQSAGYRSYAGRIANAPIRNLGALMTHFTLAHLTQDSQLDWHTDMIELPETQLISELSVAPGMDGRKFALLIEAFPHAFPSVSVVTTNGSGKTVPIASKTATAPAISSLGNGGVINQVMQTSIEDQEALLAMSQSVRKKFEATAKNLEKKRKKRILATESNSVVQAPKPVIEDLSSYDTDLDRRDRTPSVGIPGPPSTTQTAAALSSAAPANSQVDIGAILAALQGHSVSSSTPQPREQQPPLMPARTPQYARQYAAPQGQDLQATLLPNTGVSESHHPVVYRQPLYTTVPSPAPVGLPPTAGYYHAPPRPQQPAPQYITDQYGRLLQLIPVDAAAAPAPAAPVEYSPQQYAGQQYGQFWPA